MFEQKGQCDGKSSLISTEISVRTPVFYQLTDFGKGKAVRVVMLGSVESAYA
jgi:hypothetical protein